MQFWPLAVVILGSGFLALSGIVLMVRRQKPDLVGISPHHRSNQRTDALHAREANASDNQTTQEPPMPVDKPATMDQLRSLIGSDGASKLEVKRDPAPAASPLGTDDEAGGSTPSSERMEMARVAEERIKAAAAKTE